jgi:hypothetical protein
MSGAFGSLKSSLSGWSSKVIPLSFRRQDADDEDEDTEQAAGLGRLAHLRVSRFPGNISFAAHMELTALSSSG